MSALDIELHDAQSTIAWGRWVGARLRRGDLIILSGDLGAGKTTFTRGIGEALGVRGAVSSPTFVLVREHPSTVQGPALIHVDAYRLGSPAEVDDLDLPVEEAVTVVEWGEGRVEHLAESRLLIRFTPQGSGRRAHMEACGPRWTPSALAALVPADPSADA